DRAERLFSQRQVDRLHLEQPLVLLDQRVLGLDQNLLERGLVQILERGDNRQTADEFGDQAIFEQVLRLDFAEDFALLAILGGDYLGAEADRGRPATRRNDLFKASEGTAADEQDVGRIDLPEFLLRMLAAALRWHGSDGAFHDLQQRLLHALARDVAGDRRVVRLARDLVDLVDIDDPALRPGDVEVGRLDQPQQDVLDVLTDIAGLGERGGIGDAERHVEDARQRLREQRLARARGPDEQDVRLLELDLVDRRARVD